MGFLSDVVDEVKRRLERHPLDDSRMMNLALGLPPTRPFAGALWSSRPPAVIAEVKRASPSAGRIGDVEAAGRARQYERAGASAVSVLTEANHFDGGLDPRPAEGLSGAPVAADRVPRRGGRRCPADRGGAVRTGAEGDAQCVRRSRPRGAGRDALGGGSGQGARDEREGRRGERARSGEPRDRPQTRALAPAGRSPRPYRRAGERRERARGSRARGRRRCASGAGRRDADARRRRRRDPSRVAGRTMSVTAATLPDARGRFGRFGGRYVPEILIPALDELAISWSDLREDAAFRGELDALLRDYVGRPSPLTFASRLSDALGYRIWLKREDLNHTGAHKINNTLGQVLPARRLGKQRIIAETGAGMHGVATATACALFGLPCVVYMGEEDTVRQAPNVARMQLLGAEVVTVTSGSRTLKDAMNEAMRDWAASVRETHYVIGSVAGPHPFPVLGREFQRVIGEETRSQLRDVEGRDPDAVVACVGGGSNAMGIFAAFVGAPDVRLIGVEAGGEGLERGRHGA